MRLLFLNLAVFCALTLFAQEPQTNEQVTEPQTVLLEEQTETTVVLAEKKQSDNGFLSHLSIAFRASTMGGGLQVATPINDYFKLRAGIDYFNLKPSSSWSIGLEDDSNGSFEKAFGYIPDYKMKGKVNFTNGNVLVDFHPTKGIFHLTAGVFIGTNKLKAEGFLADMDGNPAELKAGVTEWPNIDFDGHRLTLNDANLDAELQLGKVIKPYFGLGLGRAIANKRVSFKFELGVIYQGKYSLKQNGKTVDVVKEASENFEDIDTYTNILKWWPMMNFQLSYKIF